MSIVQARVVPEQWTFLLNLNYSFSSRSYFSLAVDILTVADCNGDHAKLMYSRCIVGTADGNTRHEAETFAPACVGLGIGEGSWQD